MEYIQGRAAESTFRLALSGVAAPGILFGDVTVRIRKEGDSALAVKTLVTEDWLDLGFGIYAISWSAVELDTLGDFAFFLTGAGFDAHFENFKVAPAPLALLASPEVCVITGNVVDLAGRSMADQTQSMNVTFRVSRLPQLVGGTSLVTSGIIRTSPDAYGNFSVALIRGASVLVEIDALGLKQAIEIPDQSSAALVDLLPPI